MVAKAELHCHIEGTASPALAREKAALYGVDISAFVRDDAYIWHDFTSFLVAYDAISMLFRTAEDYADLAERYLTRLARDGAIYSEFFISTDHAVSAGLDPQAYIEGLAEGIRRARNATGIECRMIATGLRHIGPEAVEHAARFVTANPHPLITGFGMAGDERMHHAADFRRAFDIARDAGLGLTVHAGEFAGATSVRDALDALKPSRIGHGVRAIEDRDLVKRLAEEGIVLECCPGSNIALGVYDSFEDHPFKALSDAGVKVTLNSDDPPFFHTDLGREYDIACDVFRLDDDPLRGITRTAIKAAFIDEETRAKLLAKLLPVEKPA
ncbi:adenosine deaminase [Paramesorhizobium deserti]|uniref:Adenine deaminase n=1 Tax=Paramesorhizobium deserti TaxID=1494590 RepID=A0A135I088_9HYPH|nr:adenosine deaminase [Paramesorhizobium deserti]KXF78841.1 adenosine deaminase [Paramesorhizobium deserti]